MFNTQISCTIIREVAGVNRSSLIGSFIYQNKERLLSSSELFKGHLQEKPSEILNSLTFCSFIAIR